MLSKLLRMGRDEPARSDSRRSTVRSFGGSAASNVGASAPSPTEDARSGQNGQLIELGGIRFSAVELESTEALSAVVFDSIVNESIKLSVHLFSRIAVAKVSPQSRHCILFADRSKVTADDLSAVVQVLRHQGLHLPSEGVQGYFAASNLVVSLSQGHINSQDLRTAREQATDPTKNALFSAFLDVVRWGYIQGADDIDFVVDITQADSHISFKIGGRYVHPARFAKIPTETLIQILGIAWQRSAGGAAAQFEIKLEQQSKVELELRPGQGVKRTTRLRLRWQGSPYDRGTVVTMRIQRLGAGALIRSLDDAGYLPSQLATINRCMKSEGGMVILAGVVGSGKSTTLASMLRMLPNDMKKISIEDPVELEIPGMYQKTVSRELGSTGDDPAMVAATRAIFRSALDVFYLGEIRDTLTGMLARTVVESGHSVYSTSHARSGLGVIERLASPAVGVPRDVLAAPGIVKLMVYQLLISKLCPHCCKSPDEHAHYHGLSGIDLENHNNYFARLERLYRISRNQFRLRHEAGCAHCRKDELPGLNGLQGRTVVAEMVELDDVMRDCILRGDSVALYRHWRSLSSDSFQDEDLTGKTAMECAVLKASRGQIDPREVESRFMSFETVERQRQLEGAVQLNRKTVL